MKNHTGQPLLITALAIAVLLVVPAPLSGQRNDCQNITVTFSRAVNPLPAATVTRIAEIVNDLANVEEGTTDLTPLKNSPWSRLLALKQHRPLEAQWALATIINDRLHYNGEQAFKAASAYRRMFGEDAGPVLSLSELGDRISVAMGALSGPLSEQEMSLVAAYACSSEWYLNQLRNAPVFTDNLQNDYVLQAEGVIRHARRLERQP